MLLHTLFFLFLLFLNFYCKNVILISGKLFTFSFTQMHENCIVCKRKCFFKHRLVLCKKYAFSSSFPELHFSIHSFFIFLHSLKSDLNCHLNKVPLREFLQWIYNIKLVVKFTVSFVYVAKLNCICDVQGGTTTLMMVSFTETDRMRKRRVECCWESRGKIVWAVA